MPTYNEVHQANIAILEGEKVIKRLQDVNGQLKAEIEVFDKLSTSLDETAKIITPTLREYLTNIRGLRMAFGEEVKHIIMSTEEMTKLTKNNDKIKELAGLVMMLNDTLTKGDLTKRIKEIFNV